MPARSVAGGEAPDAVRIAVPAHRVGAAVSAVRVSRAAAVLEIIESGCAHRRVEDAAEIDEQLAVLLTEQGREGQATGCSLAAPEARVGRRPLLPQVDWPRMHRRSQREDVD